MRLHGYWRSSAAYRVRIALHLKGLAYEQVAHDLRRQAQRDPAFLALAPQGLVPALEIGAVVLTQSSAILEWLEERHPQPALLPADPEGRAIVRAMAALIACDVHPLNNLRVLNALKADFGASQDQIGTWIHRWIVQGLEALEAMIDRHGAGFCFGQTVTLADCHLAPQIYSAQRFNVDLTAFPHILRVMTAVSDLPAFTAAHPSVQPDADA